MNQRLNASSPVFETDCDFDQTAERQFVCVRCHRVVNTVGIHKPENIHAPCKVKAPAGPGTWLKYLISLLGLSGYGGCGCEGMVKRMNRWGVDGCHEHLEEIEAKLNEAKELIGYLALTKAAALAVRHGLPLSVRGLVDEAIRRAEAGTSKDSLTVIGAFPAENERS
jgi:hypothetical protein